MTNNIDSQPRDTSGRFDERTKCDCCGKAVNFDVDHGPSAHCTDDEVCGGSDGPGFYLCSRAACGAKQAGLDVEARRALYTARRAKNEAR